MRKQLTVILAALAVSTLPGIAATQKSSTKLGMLDCVIEGPAFVAKFSYVMLLH